MKNKLLLTFQAAIFGLSQAKVSKIYRILLSVLDDTLARLKLAPCRDSTAFKEVLGKLPIQVRWLDDTENPIQRNCDQDAQKRILVANSMGIG